MNPEQSLLNHILKTGDIVSPLNADVDKSFVQYNDEWRWIKDYYVRYREVPPRTEFFHQFPHIDEYNTDGVIEFYIEELHKYKAKRVLNEVITEAASTLREIGPYPVINKLTKHLAQLGRDTKMIKDIDLISNAEERLESLRERIELRKSGKTILGIPTGFQKLDEYYGGIQKGDFWVLAGWTGSLKSWLALKLAQNAWSEGYRVLYLSLELSEEQVGYRFDTLLGGGKFKNSELTHAKETLVWDHYKNWMDTTFKDKQPFVVVTNKDLDEVTQNTVLAKIEQWKPHLIVIDYVGLMDDASGAMGETEKLKNLSKSFKRIANKTDVPIIAITAVTQDKKDIGERPARLHELAWSKQLGYDSDLTLSLCKHGEYLEIEAVKVRRSSEFKFWLQWDVDSGMVSEVVKSYNSDTENVDEDGTGVPQNDDNSW